MLKVGNFLATLELKWVNFWQIHIFITESRQGRCVVRLRSLGSASSKYELTMKNLSSTIASVVALSTPIKAETRKEMFVTLDGCQRTYLQKVLSGKGFYMSGIDGLWGKRTAKAVARYSKGKNI